MFLERLTRQELRVIIGTPVKASQFRWLTDHGWPHDADIAGNPVVLRSVALERLGAKPPKAWKLDETNVA